MSNTRWCVNIQQQDALRLDSRNDSGENLKIGPVMLRSGMRAIWKTVASRVVYITEHVANRWAISHTNNTQNVPASSYYWLATRPASSLRNRKCKSYSAWCIPTTRKFFLIFLPWRICINQSILKLIISLYYLGDGSVLLGLCGNKSHQRTRRMFDRLLLSFGWLLLLLLLLLRAQLGVKILVGISGA
jgi:hypothetical protein